MLNRLKRLQKVSLLLLVGILILTIVGLPPDAVAQERKQTGLRSDAVAQVSRQAVPSSLETTVIPGERIGPVTHNTTRQDLSRIFGERNLTDREIAGAEGETEPGTVVNLGPQRSFTVIWANSNRSEAVAAINLGSAWKTPEGIGVGTPFGELQQKLGEFKLYGFEWDYGGTVVLEGSQLSRYDGQLILQVAPSQQAMQRSPQEYRAVVGDSLFPSSDPNLSRLEIAVDQMSVYLTNNAQ